MTGSDQVKETLTKAQLRAGAKAIRETAFLSDNNLERLNRLERAALAASDARTPAPASEAQVEVDHG